MRPLAALTIALLTACAEDDEPPPPRPDPPPSVPAAPNEPQSAAQPGTDRAAFDAAAAAYRGLMDAYNRGDAQTYRAGFARPMDCYHGRAQGTMDRAPGEGTHIRSHELRLLSAAAGDVLFADFGGWQENQERFGTHAKLIHMRLMGTRWFVTAEAPVAQPGCVHLPDGANVEPDAHFLECRRAQTACARTIRDWPEDEIGNGYYLALDACSCEMFRCLGELDRSCEG